MDLCLLSPVLGNHVPRTPWLLAPLNNFQAQLCYSMWELIESVFLQSTCFFFAGIVKKKASYQEYVHCMLDWAERIEMCS